MEQTITNPGGVWGATAGPSHQIVETYVNGSAGTLLAGDVVICSEVTGTIINTTTSASNLNVIGVVLPSDRGLRTVGSGETYAIGAIVPVCVSGDARINIGGNTVAAGGVLSTSGTAKVAAVAGNAADTATLQALTGSFIAIAKESQAAKDANSTIRAHIRKM